MSNQCWRAPDGRKEFAGLGRCPEAPTALVSSPASSGSTGLADQRRLKRGSDKDQRGQDQRRHETQVQQVQGELCQLAQTLVAKQEEVTRSGQDCARLSAELADASRELRESQQTVREVQRARAEITANPFYPAVAGRPRRRRREFSVMPR